MSQTIRLTLLTASAIAIVAMTGAVSRGVAQDGAIKVAEVKKGAAPRSAAPRTMAPRPAAPRVAPRTMAPKTVTRPVAPKTVTPRTMTAPKTVAPRTLTAPKQPIAPRTVAPRTATPRTVAPRQAIGPKAGTTPRRISGPGFRAIGPSRSGRIIISGRNYSVWRGSHRVRYRGRWATLAAIGALGVIVYSGASYYPYAYVSATGPYCEGLTDDGCVLQWQEVPTIDGESVLQCVTYCPWQ
jgi:hypothetical protein